MAVGQLEFFRQNSGPMAQQVARGEVAHTPLERVRAVTVIAELERAPAAVKDLDQLTADPAIAGGGADGAVVPATTRPSTTPGGRAWPAGRAWRGRVARIAATRPATVGTTLPASAGAAN